MLTAQGFIAKFSYERPDGTKYWTTRPLAYWNDDGEGVVIDDDGRLRVVDHFSNFAGYEDDQAIGVIPASLGTRAILKSGEKIPVVGWIVDTAGWTKPLFLTDEGVRADDDSDVTGYEHPDFIEIATP